MFPLHRVPEFQTYLQTGDVDHFRVLERFRTSPTSRYEIIAYKPLCLRHNNHAVPHCYRWMRSVVVTREEAPRRVVCMAPPKVCPMNEFPWMDEGACVEQDWVEGTMINVFWDEDQQSFVPCTRRCVGAHNTYHYRCPSFAKLFRESFDTAGASWDMFDRSLCYSFVLQHPLNRMTVPVPFPQLFLIQAFQVLPNGVEVQEVALDMAIRMPLQDTTIHCLTSRPWRAQSIYRYQHTMVPYQEVGIMVRHKYNGLRIKMMNPAHRYVRELRGNAPLPCWRFLELRRDQRLVEYLEYFPGEYSAFFAMERQYQTVAYALLEWYHLVYTAHKVTLRQVPKQLQGFVRALQHQWYLPTLQHVHLYSVYRFMHQCSILAQYKAIFQNQAPCAHKNVDVSGLQANMKANIVAAIEL